MTLIDVLSWSDQLSSLKRSPQVYKPRQVPIALKEREDGEKERVPYVLKIANITFPIKREREEKKNSNTSNLLSRKRLPGEHQKLPLPRSSSHGHWDGEMKGNVSRTRGPERFYETSDLKRQTRGCKCSGDFTQPGLVLTWRPPKYIPRLDIRYVLPPPTPPLKITPKRYPRNWPKGDRVRASGWNRQWGFAGGCT